jgi:hypothetical protein
MAEMVYMKASCGWCMTDVHEKCMPTLNWGSKTYVCGCTKCDVKSSLGAGTSVESEVEEPTEPTEEEENGTEPDNEL